VTSSFRTIDIQSAAADVSSVLEYPRQRYRIGGPDIGIALALPAMQKRRPNSSEFFPTEHPLHFRMAGLLGLPSQKNKKFTDAKAELRNSARELAPLPTVLTSSRYPGRCR
jgi:hypothetical protein